MKTRWAVLLGAIVLLGLTFRTNAENLSFGLQVPVELQRLSVNNFYDNLEVTGGYHIFEKFEIEASLLVPAAPIFASLSGKFTFLTLWSEKPERHKWLGFYLGAGLIYISVASESLWGGQGLLGLEWPLSELPISFLLDIGVKFFSIFLNMFSGPFINLGVRVNF